MWMCEICWEGDKNEGFVLSKLSIGMEYDAMFVKNIGWMEFDSSTWDGVLYPHCAFVIGCWVCVNKGIVTIWEIKNSVGKRTKIYLSKIFI